MLIIPCGFFFWGGGGGDRGVNGFLGFNWFVG